MPNLNHVRLPGVLIGLLPTLLTLLTGCSQRHASRLVMREQKFAPPVEVVSSPDDLKTVDEYWDFIKHAGQEHRASSDKQILEEAIQALGAMESESARAVARSLIKVGAEEGIVIASQLPTGAPTMTNRELAQSEVACMGLMSQLYAESPVPSNRSRRLALKLADALIRNAPGDLTAALAGTMSCFRGTAWALESPDHKALCQSIALCYRHWRQRLDDASRPITLSTRVLCSGKSEMLSPEGFLYQLYSQANFFALWPEDNRTGHELQNFLASMRGLSMRAAAVDPSLQSAADAFNNPKLTAYAKRWDEALELAHTMRPDVDRFVKAIEENDNVAIVRLSSDPVLQTAKAWRRELRIDENSRAPKLLEWTMGIADGPRSFYLFVRPVGSSVKWTECKALEVSGPDKSGNLTISAHPESLRKAATTQPQLLSTAKARFSMCAK